MAQGNRKRTFRLLSGCFGDFSRLRKLIADITTWSSTNHEFGYEPVPLCQWPHTCLQAWLELIALTHRAASTLLPGQMRQKYASKVMHRTCTSSLCYRETPTSIGTNRQNLSCSVATDSYLPHQSMHSSASDSPQLAVQD